MGTYSASRTLVVGRAFPSTRNPKTLLVRSSIYPQGVFASYPFLGPCQACTPVSRHHQGHSIDIQNTCRYYPMKASYDGGGGRPARRSARLPNLRSGSVSRRPTGWRCGTARVCSANRAATQGAGNRPSSIRKSATSCAFLLHRGRRTRPNWSVTAPVLGGGYPRVWERRSG